MERAEHEVGEERSERIQAKYAAEYHTMVARSTFLGGDRPDLEFAATEASMWMAKQCYNYM